MDRYEFMWKLKSLLSDISEQEREEALQYYNDYFEDAGKENEASVIASLGSPEKVAETIKRDMGQSSSFDEYENPKVERGHEIAEYSQGYQEERWQSAPEEKQTNTGSKVLLVILLICASPILLGLAAAVFGVCIGLIGACIGIVAGFGGASLGLMAGAVACVVVGILCFQIDFPTGLAFIGAGLLLAAIGLVFLMMTVGICGFVIPKICLGIGWLCRTCFTRKKKSNC